MVKLDGLKSEKVRISVTCDGIRSSIPKGKSPSITNTSGQDLEMDLLIWISKKPPKLKNQNRFKRNTN